MRPHCITKWTRSQLRRELKRRRNQNRINFKAMNAFALVLIRLGKRNHRAFRRSERYRALRKAGYRYLGAPGIWYIDEARGWEDEVVAGAGIEPAGASL